MAVHNPLFRGSWWPAAHLRRRLLSKSNPPREDWTRDYATAAEDGMNVFRHWFLWAAIEVAPGVYDSRMSMAREEHG